MEIFSYKTNNNVSNKNSIMDNRNNNVLESVMYVMSSRSGEWKQRNCIINGSYLMVYRNGSIVMVIDLQQVRDISLDGEITDRLGTGYKFILGLKYDKSFLGRLPTLELAEQWVQDLSMQKHNQQSSNNKVNDREIRKEGTDDALEHGVTDSETTDSEAKFLSPIGTTSVNNSSLLHSGSSIDQLLPSSESKRLLGLLDYRAVDAAFDSPQMDSMLQSTSLSPSPISTNSQVSSTNSSPNRMHNERLHSAHTSPPLPNGDSDDADHFCLARNTGSIGENGGSICDYSSFDEGLALDSFISSLDATPARMLTDAQSSSVGNSAAVKPRACWDFISPPQSEQNSRNASKSHNTSNDSNNDSLSSAASEAAEAAIAATKAAEAAMEAAQAALDSTQYEMNGSPEAADAAIEAAAAAAMAADAAVTAATIAASAAKSGKKNEKTLEMNGNSNNDSGSPNYTQGISRLIGDETSAIDSSFMSSGTEPSMNTYTTESTNNTSSSQISCETCNDLTHLAPLVAAEMQRTATRKGRFSWLRNAYQITILLLLLLIVSMLGVVLYDDLFGTVPPPQLLQVRPNIVVNTPDNNNHKQAIGKASNERKGIFATLMDKLRGFQPPLEKQDGVQIGLMHNTPMGFMQPKYFTDSDITMDHDSSPEEPFCVVYLENSDQGDSEEKDKSSKGRRYKLRRILIAPFRYIAKIISKFMRFFKRRRHATV